MTSLKHLALKRQRNALEINHSASLSTSHNATGAVLVNQSKVKEHLNVISGNGNVARRIVTGK